MATKRAPTSNSTEAAAPQPSAPRQPGVQAAPRGARKVRTGVVVSDRMMKTVVVRVDRMIKHKLYPRMMRSSNTFAAHNENNAAKIGDLVRITETRPLSRTKRWRVVEVLRRGAQPGAADAGLVGAEEGKAKVKAPEGAS